MKKNRHAGTDTKVSKVRPGSLGTGLGMLVFSVLLVWAVPVSAVQKEQIVAGAGPSTKVVMSFVALLNQTEVGRQYNFSVPPKSIKHAGGIRSTEEYVFGRTGRPLNEREKAGGVEEIFLAKMPIAFVAGAGAGVQSLTLEQVCSIFTGGITNWKDVGGSDNPIAVIAREPTEALFQTLKKDVPCMRDIVATKYVLKKDDHVVEMLKSTEDGQMAIGFGAARNFSRTLQVSGFDSGVNLGLVYQASKRDDPLVNAARETARSEHWKTAVLAMGLGLP